MTDFANDTLVLGGHEFHSRFILGSGKYSYELIKAAVENAGAQIITMALRRASTGIISWTISRKGSHYFRIHPALRQ